MPRMPKTTTEEVFSEDSPPEKNPHAAALGRLGGRKGGRARAAKLTPEQRTQSARYAAQKRWGKINTDQESD
jgi:hypothetical protein